jgi:hypothetical protein
MRKINKGGRKMSTSMMLGIFDWIGDFFKALFDIIPKTMYLLYASAACVLDVLQLFFRKLAGLDVYYVNGSMVEGDIVQNFILGILGFKSTEGVSYSALSTVFWSMIVFGIIICFGSTIVAVIKSHYTYDEKSAKGPMQYVYTGGKAIINIAAVPIIIVLSLYVSQALLTALDTITTTSSDSIVALYGTDAVNTWLAEPVSTAKTVGGLSTEKTYIRYDIFGFDGNVRYGTNTDLTWLSDDATNHALVGSKTQTFSGTLFKVAAYNANRARTGEMSAAKGNFTGGQYSNMKLFAKAGDDDAVLAEMIDTAFANNLRLNSVYLLDYTYDNDVVSMKYFTNYLTMFVWSYSKFNIGLVWYYYDLWQFNFIVGFGAFLFCIMIFINIIIGLMKRLFMCIVLFLVAPPLFGLSPIDGGEGAKAWRKNFKEQVLMAYGAVVGMNLVMMLLPYFNDIDFFNIPIADYFAQTIVLVVGLVSVKAVIATLSSLVGGADANKSGDEMKEDVSKVAGTGLKMTVGAAKLGVKARKGVISAIHSGGHAVATAKNSIQANSEKKSGMAAEKMRTGMTDKMISDMNDSAIHGASDKQLKNQLKEAGVSDRRQRNEAVKAYRESVKAGGDGSAASVRGQLRKQRSEHTKDALAAKARERHHSGAFKSNLNAAVHGEAHTDKGIIKTALGDKGTAWMKDKGKAIANSKFGKATGGALKTVWEFGGQAQDAIGETFYKNIKSFDSKGIGTFVASSDIDKQPDKQDVSNAFEEWQVTHPGEKPNAKQLESLRQGKMPK